MAVCLFTFHGYGTWWPDHPRGYTTKDEGVLPPDAAMGEMYRGQAKFDSIQFDAGIQAVLIAGAYDICSRRHWQLHAVGTDPTHAHYLISQPGYFDFIPVRDRLKNVLSLFLGRYTGIKERQWFAGGGSNKRVKDRGHFDYLVKTYLPDQRGMYWNNKRAILSIPDGIL